MKHKLLSYRHDLGNCSYLNAFSINPSICMTDLKSSVEDSLLTAKRKSKINLEKLAESMTLFGSFNSFSDLNFEPSFDKYQVPELLKAYRDAVKLKFSDSIIVAREGIVSSPLKVIKGEYRDFVSTHLKKVPSDLAPNDYEAGKTIAELLPEFGLSYKDVARYMGFAHFMRPSNGEEFSFVYRDKNVHIASDCIALSGSTPRFPDQFNHKDFNFDKYFLNHLAEEMKEEYMLDSSEFKVRGIHLIDDVNEIPFAVIEIFTPLSTKELAEKSYNQPNPIKEHSIFYSTNREGVRNVLNQIDVFPSTARVMDILTK